MKKNQKSLAFLGTALLGAALIPSLTSLYAADEAVSPSATTTIETSDLVIGIEPGKPTDWTKKYELLAPGDTVITFVDLVNKAEAPIGTVKLTATGTGKIMEGPTPLDANLNMCSVQYDNQGGCPGTEVQLGDASESVATLNQITEKDQRYYLKLVTVMPYNADNSYQGADGSITYRIEATQAPSDNNIPVPKEG